MDTWPSNGSLLGIEVWHPTAIAGNGSGHDVEVRVAPPACSEERVHCH